ncbi:MAG: helix-turn-helix domain-containing protein [Prevotellaceae bacterium]|nr:helix-turn-helix domain-containing protein [Prevotellaceae bacterium]
MEHLTQAQRNTIFRMLQSNYTQIVITEAIGKDKLTVSCEIRRNASGVIAPHLPNNMPKSVRNGSAIGKLTPSSVKRIRALS